MVGQRSLSQPLFCDNTEMITLTHLGALAVVDHFSEVT